MNVSRCQYVKNVLGEENSLRCSVKRSTEERGLGKIGILIVLIMILSHDHLQMLQSGSKLKGNVTEHGCFCQKAALKMTNSKQPEDSR